MGFLMEYRTSMPKRTSHDCISQNRLLHFLLTMEKSNFMNLRNKYELSTQNKCFKGGRSEFTKRAGPFII